MIDTKDKTIYNHDEFAEMCDAIVGTGSFDQRVMRFDWQKIPFLWIREFRLRFDKYLPKVVATNPEKRQLYYYELIGELHASVEFLAGIKK